MLSGAHGKQWEQSKVTAPQGRGQATAGEGVCGAKWQP